jgi:bifunctional DNA-binding transcriptional regulator/antitoxin component of YhaV-PrlF toxin-antitoxin module
MPQLEKGGKYVFGWSQIGENRGIIIPREAADEYGYNPGMDIILISGSKSSGGFIIAIKSLLKQSVMGSILTDKPELDDERAQEGEIFGVRERKYCRARIGENNCIILNPQVLEAFGVAIGDRLLAIRGSYIGLTMILKGLIVECARKHSELESF